MNGCRHRIKCIFACLVIGCASLFGTGCARDKYFYGMGTKRSATPISFDGSGLQVTQGGEHPKLDRIERVVDAPKKFVLEKLLRRPPKTTQEEIQSRDRAVQQATRFLTENGMPDVKVDVDRYEPAEQWARLRANDSVAWGWKYTVGAGRWVRYSLLPNRIFDRDFYDPFTNTLHLNSAGEDRVLLEAASAKIYSNHELLGTYAALQRLPIVPAVHYASAGSDLLTYVKVTDGEARKRNLYPRVYGQVAASSARGLSSGTLLGDIPLAGTVTTMLMRMTGTAVGSATAKWEETRATGSQ
jgi:hypothetical protein